MPNEVKDKWDKADVILRPVGGLLTALVVGYLGILGSQYLKRREALEADTQLYAELLSKKQDRDTTFRRDILKPSIDVVMSREAPIESVMLNLELLMANFQESLDLGPFLKRTHRQLLNSKTPDKERYLRILQRDARELMARQLVDLGGQQVEADVNFDNLMAHPEGVPLVDRDLRLHSEDAADDQKRHFSIHVFGVDQANEEVEIRLQVATPRTTDKHGPANYDRQTELDVLLWIGSFDFPMSHSLSLSHGQRCAVILRNFEKTGAQIALASFPESSEDPVQVLKKKVAEAR